LISHEQRQNLFWLCRGEKTKDENPTFSISHEQKPNLFGLCHGEKTAFEKRTYDSDRTYRFKIEEKKSHHGGTGVPPRWDWSLTTMGLECHHGGTESMQSCD